MFFINLYGKFQFLIIQLVTVISTKAFDCLLICVKLELICHFCFNSTWIHNENLCPLKCYRAMIVHNQMAFTEQALC